MMILHQWKTEKEPCAYLPDRLSRLRYEMVGQITGDEYEARMNAGWRKFGPLLFRPQCPACAECRPIRIPSEIFTPNRSQSRTLTKNADLLVRYNCPTVDETRLHLYRRYHDAQTARKGWPEAEKDESEYQFSFVQNPIPSVEITAWQPLPGGGEALRLVVLTDITPNVVSGVYHFHDPDMSERGLGTFGMLHTIELAKRLQKRWAYFGFYVAGCPSLSYKSRFAPCEVMDTSGQWQPFTG
jgi:arginine-tRNA-protein transferase